MRVLISGAGIAGPTVAWFLAKAGARVSIVEKAPRLLPYGQNIDITGSAIAIIKKMGLLEEVRRLNTTEKGTQFIDSRGHPFAPFPVKGGADFTSEFEILRGDLAKILYEAAKDHPNVDYSFNTTIKRVVSNDTEAVKVELSNGNVEQFDVLIAADGQWSKLRNHVFSSEGIEVVDKGLFCVYFTIPRLPDDNDWWNIYPALGSRGITLRPDPHGTIRATLTCMPCNNAQKQAWLDASKKDRKIQQKLVRQQFADAGWQAQRILNAMDQAPDFYFHAIQQIRMSKWHSSRIICLGDTAFAPTPLTGMGTSLAIDGAYVLAGELSKLANGEHPSKALESYEAAFRPFVEKIQKIPFFVPAVTHPETAWKRWMLHTLVSTFSRVAAMPWVTKWFRDSVDKEDFPLSHYPRLNVNAS